MYVGTSVPQMSQQYLLATSHLDVSTGSFVLEHGRQPQDHIKGYKFVQVPGDNENPGITILKQLIPPLPCQRLEQASKPRRSFQPGIICNGYDMQVKIFEARGSFVIVPTKAYLPIADDEATSAIILGIGDRCIVNIL